MAEMDVIIDTPADLTIIECTIERSRRKAEQDITKIRAARRSLLGDLQNKPVHGYFVTQGDPTPEIHQIAAENGTWIEACSFPAFVNRFNCSSTYLIERRKRPFGSVRNPVDDTIHIARNQYVPVPFKVYESNQEITIDSIIHDINARRKSRLIATGDFGIGKSMTYREIFFRLAELYETGQTFRFPVYINLSDTSVDENDDFVDLLERHAKWLGLRAQRDKLVHAWTSDCCTLILDGFDELIRAGFTRLTTSSRDIRYASSRIIRISVSESPKSTPILISGRQSYFSHFDEMRQCLGAKEFSLLSLQDLRENEVKALFRKINPKMSEPVLMEWLPQRPLLLSYIYFELGETIASDDELLNPLSPGIGWNILLDRLCARETNVARGAEPKQIRRLLERIALFARTNVSEPGRVTSLHVADAYRDVMLIEPDISVQQVLMRFPGLTTGHANEERAFIEDSIFEAAQSGSLVEVIEALASKSEEYVRPDGIQKLMHLFTKTTSAITALSAEVVNATLKQQERVGLLSVALDEAMRNEQTAAGNLPADLLICASLQPDRLLRKELKAIGLRAASIPRLEITPELISGRKLLFEDCIFEELDLSFNADSIGNVSFLRCRIQRLSCAQDVAICLRDIGLESGEVEEISVIDATNADIMEMSIPPQLKALKIILRKLFQQKGSGRRRGALYRGIHGIDPDIVDRCLAALLKSGIVYVVGGNILTILYGIRTERMHAE